MHGEHNPITQKLMKAFMQFKKVGWHQRTVAGYNPSEIRVLFCIRKGAMPDSEVLSMKVSDISKLLHVTSPTITQLLKNLEADGLVERNIDPTDRRAVDVKLTQKGEKITQLAADSFSSSLDGLVDYLGEEQSNQLVDILSKVFLYYNEKEASVSHAYWNGDNEA